MQLYNESFENKNKLDLSNETICSIVNATELHKELYHECCKQNNITICLNSKLKSIVSQNELVELTTTNDKKFNSNYLFVSDGKKSQVKEFLKLEEKKYHIILQHMFLNFLIQKVIIIQHTNYFIKIA